MENKAVTLILGYTDFVVELARRKIGEVRLWSGTRGQSVPDSPGPYLDYIIVLTALDNRGNSPVVLACKFYMGGCWEIFKDQHPENVANLEKAVVVLEADLNHWALDVRSGVYAHDNTGAYAHDNNWGYAASGGLWHFRKQDGKAILIAEPAEGQESLCQERSARVRQAMLEAGGEVAR